MKYGTIFVGNNPLKVGNKEVTGSLIKTDGDEYYKISNYDLMRAFFMSIVSSTDLWMFISSTGGLSAGRKNPDTALFPYDTDDKISDSAEITGSKTILIVEKDGRSFLWEPFSDRYSGIYNVERNLYKSIYGDHIIFEEINRDLNVRFRYGWYHSEKFGFVKRSKIQNFGKYALQAEVLDGIQNILPSGVLKKFQTEKSNLVNAYKKNELIEEIGLGVYSLSSNIVDRPEPSESLKATTVWSTGMRKPEFLLSSVQLDDVRQGREIHQETDVRAERGAYFIRETIELKPGITKEWFMVAEVNQGAEKLSEIELLLKGKIDPAAVLIEDISAGRNNLQKIIRESDGIQLSEDQLSIARHIANVTFNVMRGGIFENGYQIEKNDFKAYLVACNKPLAKKYNSFFLSLPSVLSCRSLKEKVKLQGDKDLLRICYEYLPLYFSRRHGDPSRPWNTFSIETKKADGEKILNYEGNWRDIFQNWEALAVSYPDFVECMIAKFLNSSTADGYNPYRITRNGIEWEITDPDDPWSFIGYWGDHQIIYLLKLLELSDKYHPGVLEELLDQNLFSLANVPYRIKTFEKIIKNPFDTIAFDSKLNSEIEKRVAETGADGKLIWNADKTIKKVNLAEKLLIPLLAKLSNFIPGGGIWLNTQRPEWNDANNALVGFGVSMVTLYYIRRYVTFLKSLLSTFSHKEISVSSELKLWFEEIFEIFMLKRLTDNIETDPKDRFQIIKLLGEAKDRYNQKVYKNYSEEISKINTQTVETFFNRLTEVIDVTIKDNKRDDKLFHAYNLLDFNSPNSCKINRLYEMLEGQVAVLSSGSLSAKESLELLDSMGKSKLFREDQYSYILYPDRQLPKFWDKNIIPEKQAEHSKLITEMLKDGNYSLVCKDALGRYHFNKEIRSAKDLSEILDQMNSKGYSDLVKSEKEKIKEIFEKIFNHKSFTGRSGTFYGYEGLNSIYWHMVSKLLLAVQENINRANKQHAEKEVIDKLIKHYYAIRAGIGYGKSPELYGAFPTDPYSHTPGNKGVQQPGMTGQVKEDILARFGELGVEVSGGKIHFGGLLLRKSEFIPGPAKLSTPGFPEIETENFIAFSLCNIPILYHDSIDEEKIVIHYPEGKRKAIAGLTLDAHISRLVFQRDPQISLVEVFLRVNKF